jgi:hypothetical protein
MVLLHPYDYSCTYKPFHWKIIVVRFEVLTAVIMRIALWALTPFSFVDINRCFREHQLISTTLHGTTFQKAVGLVSKTLVCWKHLRISEVQICGEVTALIKRK